MLRIRLRRVGRKNDPHFQIVVTPRTNATKGDYLVKLGWFDPITKQVQIDKDGLMKWLDNGAKPTNTVARLLGAQNIKHKLIEYTPSKPKESKKKEKAEEKPKTTAKIEGSPSETPEPESKEESNTEENINQETKKEEV